MGSLLSVALAYLVNYVTLVVPDIGQLISSIVRFLFFATPIFWVFDAQSSGVQRLLATYNPVSYFLGATRQALAVEPVNWARGWSHRASPWRQLASLRSCSG